MRMPEDHVRSSPSLDPCPVLGPVYRPSLTDFSINRILGLEDDAGRIIVKTIFMLQVLKHSYSDTIPRSSPYSDNTSSTSDLTASRSRRHIQRSHRGRSDSARLLADEVWELERAYKRRHIWMSEARRNWCRGLGDSSQKSESPLQITGSKLNVCPTTQSTNTADYRRSSFKSNQFRARSSLLVPMSTRTSSREDLLRPRKDYRTAVDYVNTEPYEFRFKKKFEI
ncbi:hypothetical protein OS493_028656 [Desmophyllum pertusum]|uniref:Uncharacterized protein n=1 Tax=Desmophyllum pertusum TaxID=174260 RepID=A0A9W9YLR2_9CNID|nr:hypothetical protein OS493_028656 [Desmophyllum pertusum]